MSQTRRGRRTQRTAAGIALLIVSAVVGGLLVLPAEATTVNYVGSTSGTQSSIVIHRGDQYERTLNPAGTIQATLDDTAQKVTSATVSFQSSYTPTFVGPFNLQLYVKADLEQVGAVTGTTSPSGTPGVVNLAAAATTRLRLTVFNAQADGIQRPTDGKLTDPTKCYVDLAMNLTGSANRRTGALQLKQDPFTIPAFPNGTPDPARTCGLATGSLNVQLAGANNAINLNFTGGPTTAHYTGVSAPTGNSILIKKGDWIFQRSITPRSTIVADIDFQAGKVSNVVTRFDPISMAALPGVLSKLPATARIDTTVVGTPVASMSPTGTPGLDNVSVQAKVRMAVTVSLLSNPGVRLTDPAKCYVELPLNLTGTVDRGTDALTLGSPRFTIPAFPWGCGLFLKPGLDLMVAGPNNSIALSYIDGVVVP